MIRVRRENSEIFEYFPEITRDANICKVNVAGCEAVQPYARYRGDTAIIIVPNYNVHDKSGNMTVYMPFASAGIENYKSYTVTNAVTGRELVSGSAVKVAKIDITVPYEDMLVLKVKASGKLIEPAASDSISDGDAASNEMPADNSDVNEDTDKNDKSNKKKQKTGKAEVESENNNFIIILLSSLGGILITGAAVALIFVKTKKAKSK